MIADLAKPCVVALTLFALGCGSPKSTEPVKLPRPVSVFRLAKIDPSRSSRLTGSVASWKTEPLGFEVSGRVRFVIEPETDVDGELFGVVAGEGGETVKRKLISKGRILAIIDDARYKLAVKSVEAQIVTAEQQKKAASIEVARVIPKQREATLANLKFFKSKIARDKPLLASGAVSQADFDKTQADHDATEAQLAQVDANKEVKLAEVESLQAKVNELRETLAQANRDVDDCVLRAPFRGQIATIHAVPGSVVKAGAPVVTLQMMDPIKIEIEVSAATSRQLNYRDVVTITPPKDATRPGDAASDNAPPKKVRQGQEEKKVNEEEENTEKTAFVYSVAPSADPVTRTFTVTLLVRNKKLRSPLPDNWQGPEVRARDVWKLVKAEFVQKNSLFVAADAIHTVDGQSHVWKITNWDRVAKKQTDVLEVKRLRVIPGDKHIDWLGLWSFREVSVAKPEEFNVETDHVAGALTLKGAPASFNGSKIILDRQKWELRPGDLVDVELGSEPTKPDFFVPIDAIQRTGGENFVFVVEGGRVTRRKVEVSPGPGTLKRIQTPEGDKELASGILIVASGSHYLTDGEAVNVVEEVKVMQ